MSSTHLHCTSILYEACIRSKAKVYCYVTKMCTYPWASFSRYTISSILSWFSLTLQKSTKIENKVSDKDCQHNDYRYRAAPRQLAISQISKASVAQQQCYLEEYKLQKDTETECIPNVHCIPSEQQSCKHREAGTTAPPTLTTAPSGPWSPARPESP